MFPQAESQDSLFPTYAQHFPFIFLVIAWIMNLIVDLISSSLMICDVQHILNIPAGHLYIFFWEYLFEFLAYLKY